VPADHGERRRAMEEFSSTLEVKNYFLDIFLFY